MRSKENNIVILFFTVLVIIITGCIIMQSTVKLSPGKGFDRIIYTSTDSTMIMDRHMGYVNYERFVKLTKDVFSNVGKIDISVQGDSAYFNTKYTHYFYGQNDGWIEQYKNLPIHISNDGFSAKIQEIDTIQYVFLPYQILSNIAKYGENTALWDDGINSEPRSTIIPGRELPSNNTVGKKIQTEGIVRQNVVDILSNYPNRQQEDQLSVLWHYVKDHWNYMNDPYSATDTWRAASETINDYYFVNGKRYTGDCDDFAILMASFARQIGFKSRLVCAYNEIEGHAYAEYYNGKKWVPLDWFSNEFGGEPFQGKKIIFDDL